MSDMDKDIVESIRKNLPQQVGDVLQKELNRLQGIERDHKALKEAHEKTQQSLNSKNNEINKLNELLQAHEEITKREAAVSERERNSKIEELQVKLDAAESKQQFAEKLAMGLVRNIDYRKTVYDSRTETLSNKSHPGQAGGVSQAYTPETTTVSSSTTTENKAE